MQVAGHVLDGGSLPLSYLEKVKELQDKVVIEVTPGFGVQDHHREVMASAVHAVPLFLDGVSHVASLELGKVTSDRTRGNSLKLHQERFRLDIRGKKVMERIVKPCNRLPRAVVESPSLELFQKHVDVAHEGMV
ncbi:hypothetical protein WISP_131413 [Willisornis vidua]|uniref:Uncharacterized protein n=1 Tax=Willisornis vidua TaxID=1566151 RepID=A0ABQ9CVK3_9PASS|nr:hypothetical protein WISP_131413 [Willisornis vidua]